MLIIIKANRTANLTTRPIARPAFRSTPLHIGVMFLILLWSLTSSVALASHTAGQVVFVTGDASVIRGGSPLPLATGIDIQEGDRLETGESGHMHLRMIDGAFISLRSASALSVERYRFAPSDPTGSDARLRLHHGVVRSISGEIGARSKERFRLNTPVAAIGIRGTDFSILTSPDVSRLSVRQGGVVMAPLSEQCSQLGSGPCEGESAAELFATQPGLLLEARLNDPMARLTREGLAPDDYRPPHPREDELILDHDSAEMTNTALASSRSAPGAQSYEESLQQAERYLARPGLITDAYARGESASELQSNDRGLVASPKVVWGRWSQFSEGDAVRVSRLIHNNRRYAGTNSVFALTEEIPTQRRLPDGGRAHFNLNSYEAHIKRGGALETASISHPGLVVDFDQRRFATRLDVHAGSLPGPVHVLGGGNLLESGHLKSDGDSPSRLDGVLTEGAGEAGLLFEYQISPGVDAVGATHWVLDRE